MWATCHPPEPHPRAAGSFILSSRRAVGFTLLEILVVLLLISFVAGLTLPRVMNMYNATRFATERDGVLAQLAELGRLGLERGETLTLEAEGDLRALGIELPDGWQVRVVEPLVIRPNGSCAAGTISLSGRGRLESVRLAVPFCTPEVVGSGA